MLHLVEPLVQLRLGRLHLLQLVFELVVLRLQFDL